MSRSAPEPPAAPAPVADRRGLLADAAVRVVARAGLRGLTHRAVDAEAGLPVGSTSNLLRSREALVEAVGDRLVERDGAAWGGRPLRVPGDVDELAAGLAHVTVRTCAVDPDGVLARFAVFTASPAAFSAHHRRLLEDLAAMLETLGVPEARDRARAVTDLLDGAMLHAVTVRAAEAPAREGLSRSIRALLIA